MTLTHLHIEAALADPAVKADIIDLVYRRVADWAWPAAYLKIATPEEWRKAVKGMTEQTQRKWTQDEEGNLTCLDCGSVVELCEKYDAPFWRWAQCECWATNCFCSVDEAIAAWKAVKK